MIEPGGDTVTDTEIAIIDLGSNSIVMMIMKISANGSYKMIDQAKVMVRLSKGMAMSNLLQESAMTKGCDTIKLFKKLIDAHHVTETVAVATAAVRNASNQDVFLKRIEQETGIVFSVITGEQEAYYDFLGVINTIDIEDCVIVDTGGGSTEIILVKDRTIRNMTSIPYGAVVLTEKFMKNDDELKTNLRKLDEFMNDTIRGIGWLNELKGMTIVGLGGSIRNLGKIHKNLLELHQSGLQLGGIHNYSMNAMDVDSTLSMITDTDIRERQKLSGLGKDRADIIIGGLAPLKSLMRHVRSDRLVISGHGLRDGIFFHYYYKMCGWQSEQVDDVLGHSLTNILKKYEANLLHSDHVCKLSLDLFDQLKDLHRLGPEFRKLLAAGAILHDIGLYVDYYNHHDHGFYLLLHSGIYGLTHKELLISAFIVAMHRSEDPQSSWKKYPGYLGRSEFEKVRMLGLLVRIAEGLDRNEYGNIQGIQCSITEGNVKILLSTIRSVDLEIEAARLSEKAFRKIFNRGLLIECEQNIF
jgi:exopolyphosphatase / guanosine-5'-triphosphate,3'-diphosphate pyrophosphatase